MREDDRRLAQRQHLVEHRVGRMRLVDDDAQPVGLRDQRLALLAEAAVLAFRGHAHAGRIGEIVVADVRQRDHPQALLVVEAEQAGVGLQRVGVLHADVDRLPARGLDPRRVVGGGGQLELVRVGGHHLADLGQAPEPGVARLQVAAGIAFALAGEHHPEAAIEPAFDHARVIDLRTVFLEGMAVGDLPARPGKQRRRIEMGVEVDRPGLDGARALGDLRRAGTGLGGGGDSQQQRGGQRTGLERHVELHGSPLGTDRGAFLHAPGARQQAIGHGSGGAWQRPARKRTIGIFPCHAAMPCPRP